MISSPVLFALEAKPAQEARLPDFLASALPLHKRRVRAPTAMVCIEVWPFDVRCVRCAFAE